MNIKLKFRVWDNVDYMSSPFTLEDLQFKKIQFTSDCPVMQFTGLQDKNGNDIYEGDVIAQRGQRNTYVEYNKVKWVLRYDDEKAEWRQELHNKFYKHIEIIGNIYESPQLLNSEQNDAECDTTDDDSNSIAG